MKKFTLVTSLFLILAAPSLFAQHTEKPLIKGSTTDSTKVMLQTLLNPSFQQFTVNNMRIQTNYLFDYTNNKALHYLNIFNSLMAEILLIKASNNFDMQDYPLIQSKFYNTRTAFQYNMIQKRTKFDYISDLRKKYWW